MIIVASGKGVLDGSAGEEEQLAASRAQSAITIPHVLEEGSGALFLATGALAIIGNLPSGSNARAVPIARVGELAENEWKVFDFPDQYAQGILINLPGKGLVAFSDVCTHLSCAVIYQGDGKHLHCPCHNGLFDAATGNVLAGPPIRPLPLIQLAIHNGTIYAVRVVPR